MTSQVLVYLLIIRTGIMFVYEKKTNSGLILTGEISRKSNSSNSQSGNEFNSAKAAFQSSHIFMHAVHIILSTVFTSLQKLYSNDK